MHNSASNLLNHKVAMSCANIVTSTNLINSSALNTSQLLSWSTLLWAIKKRPSEAISISAVLHGTHNQPISPSPLITDNVVFNNKITAPIKCSNSFKMINKKPVYARMRSAQFISLHSILPFSKDYGTIAVRSHWWFRLSCMSHRLSSRVARRPIELLHIGTTNINTFTCLHTDEHQQSA